jgi:hypothetical protein
MMWSYFSFKISTSDGAEGASLYARLSEIMVLMTATTAHLFVHAQRSARSQGDEWGRSGAGASPPSPPRTHPVKLEMSWGWWMGELMSW